MIVSRVSPYGFYLPYIMSSSQGYSARRLQPVGNYERQLLLPQIINNWILINSE